VTDEEQQEAEPEEDEVLRGVAGEGHADERLYGEEPEQPDAGDRDAPADPPDPRTDETTARLLPTRADLSRLQLVERDRTLRGG